MGRARLLGAPPSSTYSVHRFCEVPLLDYITGCWLSTASSSSLPLQVGAELGVPAPQHLDLPGDPPPLVAQPHIWVKGAAMRQRCCPLEYPGL